MASSPPEDRASELAVLKDRPEADRAGFLFELGWNPTGVPAPGILPYLEDPSPLVRTAAAQARWQTSGDSTELPRLVEILVDPLTRGDEELALVAGTALVQMGEAAVEPLAKIFRSLEKEEPHIVRVLGEIGGNRAVELLEEASRSEVPEVALEAAEALQALAREDAR